MHACVHACAHACVHACMGRFEATQDIELVFNFQMGPTYIHDVLELFRPSVVINMTGSDGTVEEIATGLDIPCLTFCLTDFHALSMKTRLKARLQQ